MTILAGIDEAGLGPVLGPLVVSGAAFRIPDENVHTSLWELLDESCTQHPQKGDRRLAITDSKVLFRRKQGMAPLERTALVMLALSGHHPTTFKELLTCIAPDASAYLSRYPWYVNHDLTLPVCDEVGDITTRANAIKRNCKNLQIKPLGIFSEPINTGQYNRLVKNTRNKAVVLLGLVLRVIDRIMKIAPNEHIRLCVDRLGGRTHYREAITTALPEYELQILEETTDQSVYRLVRSSRVCKIEFVTRGENKHFLIALASVYSKYLRELYMIMFNTYWCHLLDGLKPTAGYYTDAHRWLRDTAQVIQQQSIDQNLLVRER